MTLFSFGGVSVEYGATTVLRDVTWTVTPGERWGIVGRNGAGKTTLFRLLTGATAPATGAVSRRPGLRMALLDQHRDFGEAATVWAAAAASFAPLIALERSLAEQGEHLATLGSAVTEADLDRYGRDQERFQREGGYDYHARVDAVLQGLAFDPEEAVRRPVATLSGGERGRLGLAAQLAAPADLLLLDEPTNHLDLETTAWLQRYLLSLDETVVMISHDRAFLDDTVDHVLHVSNRTVTDYRGNYSSFATQRGERELALARQVADQRKLIAREEDFIRRNIAGGNSAQAKGRRRRLARLPRLSPPPGEGDAMAIRLETADRGGDQALVTEGLTVAAGARVLVREFSAVARRGDVIALVGPNGAGKSTLLATLLGTRAPAAGSARLGASVTPAWFRQDLAQVPMDRTIYECIAQVRPAWGRGPIQSHLGAFGFSGDEVQRQTQVLSGGELARVALALITLTRANLLVLDEPTNHLDVESIEALEDAIDEYQGTVLLVSHDRAFLRELATRVWAFDEDRIEDFDGPFVDWEAHYAIRERRRQAAEAELVQAERTRVRESERRRQGSGDRAAATARQARREATAAEAEVHRLEGRIAELVAAIEDPTLYEGTAAGARRAGSLGRELEAARAELDRALARWAAAVEAVEPRD
ncbi:MAG TPA: ABC-F family ATP-binding cassette domain-containing protein [Gemmatimonadales bacterium]